jgi:DNA-binding MarR family transcriptional regulator
MVTYDPDLTRLLDRLESAGMVKKERDAKDRRVVNVHITKAGRDTVESAMKAVQARLHKELEGIGKSRLEQLADLLERIRGNTP